jgi:hypothetical protein
LENDMKLKVLFPMVAAGIMASSAGSAQVADSFDNLVDQVLTFPNAANFFVGAVNTNFVSAGVDISVNVSALNSTSNNVSSGIASGNTLTDLTDTWTKISASSVAGTSSGGVFGLGAADISGSATFADLTSSNSTSASSATSNSTVSLSEVVSSFGDVSTFAAGAVNEVSITLTQVGDTATVDADYAAGSVSTGIVSTNITGGDIGVIMGALNAAPIGGSVTMSFTNAAGGADGIATKAVGALNTGSLTATFVGNNEASADVDLQRPN